MNMFEHEAVKAGEKLNADLGRMADKLHADLRATKPARQESERFPDHGGRGTTRGAKDKRW